MHIQMMALQPPQNDSNSSGINTSRCMLCKMTKSDVKAWERGNTRKYKGHTFYAVYPELLEDSWVEMAWIEANKKNSSKYLLITRSEAQCQAS